MDEITHIIRSLALDAGFNSDQKTRDYLQISRSTWFRRLRDGLRRSEIDALRARAGFVVAPNWTGCRIRGDRLWTPDQQFVTRSEAGNMWLFRQSVGMADQVPDEQQWKLKF